MFVPLHVKSDYSLGYGTAGVEELVATAAARGYQALALTDLENLCGQVRFHHECRRSILPLTGIELRPGFDGRRQVGNRAGRVVLLAVDRSGYSSLCRLVSSRRGATGGRTQGALGQDPLPLAVRYAEGLFALSDDPAVVEALIGSFPRERLGMLLLRPADLAIDRMRQETADRLRVQLVADLDAVFLHPADRDLHALQLAIRQNRQLAALRAGEELEGAERWLRPPAEAAALFADRPEAVAAAAHIAAACRLELGAAVETATAVNFDESAPKRLRVLCAETLASHPPAAPWTQNHRTRLAAELTSFRELGFSSFMLTVGEIIARCRREGIPVVVRGSAVSSLALHLLGGSPVDPIAHGLLFERFLHPGKSAWPDVDLDLPWHRREEVITWVYRHFGRERVAMVAAHHTFRQRSALREGLKAWGARPALIENLVRTLPPEDLAVEEIDFLGLVDTLSGKEANLARLAAPGLTEILPLIQRLVGRPRHLAAHPGGIVIGRGPLTDLLPLERAPKGVAITQYDFMAVARLGLVKIDLLGNRCLSELEETLPSRAGPGRSGSKTSPWKTRPLWPRSTGRRPWAASSSKARPCAACSPGFPSGTKAISSPPSP
jgi:DNA polymerase III alpha subunit